MKAIAIMNNKGGVGKTVTAINLADILANDYKQRVVLVDCDGQANLSGFFLPGIEVDTPTTGDILTGDCEQVWSDNLIPLRHNIQLLPSSSGLYDLDLQAIKDGASAPERLRVRALMTQVRTSDVVTEAEKALAAMRVPVCRTKIRRTDKVPESTVTLLPLRAYSPGSSACRDYRALAGELMEEVQ